MRKQAEAAVAKAPWQRDRGSMVGPDIEAMNVDAIRARIAELSYYSN